VADVTIKDPILNSPFREPTRHWRFGQEGITRDVDEQRRVSSYFMPIAQARKKGSQLEFDTEWTLDRIRENKEINRVRERVRIWRQGGYAGITPVTGRLLEYWSNPGREKPLFFCQIEALETAIYLTEVARKYGDGWIENYLREQNDQYNPGLPRIAFKMATGSGKTVVMAMLIAWHALNKLADKQDAKFSDTFLIITPGITIRDRLRVLLPNDPGNYYQVRDILPPDQLERLSQAKVLITNFHAFKQREKGEGSRLTKQILTRGEESPFVETPDQMVRRVCRDLGNKKNVVVINDEAHHCYRGKPEDDGEKLTGDDRIEAKRREEAARVWISGIEAVQRKLGVRAIYDLSATPFFLRGSGYPEGTLYPWVVSDFSLIDAIESGIVKIPRVPVSDDSMTGDLPTYRDLWLRIRDDLPKKGRGTDAVTGEPRLPAELQGALHSLYGNYEKSYKLWEQNAEARARGLTPPVFIVVCNNTNVSKLVFDYVAGWEKPLPKGGTIVVPGELPLFSNERDGGWSALPNTILVDSEQLESGEAMSADFKKMAAGEIEEFKAEYRQRFPGRDVDKLTDEDLLREVMNTVGKQGKLGEGIRCVVSVSMLTEGWDANTVTHILGVRAFGTQLLCEQVVGRGLRRMTYVTGDDGHFEPEYAEVFGVPFSFLPCSGSSGEVKTGPTPTRVRALEERIACEITFPRVAGYRYEVGEERLEATFTEDTKYVLSTQALPTMTENAPIVGETSKITLDDLKKKRLNEVAFKLARYVLNHYFRDDDQNPKMWLFPQLVSICRRWIDECLVCRDHTFPQQLLISEFAEGAADRIYKAITLKQSETARLKPILRPYDTIASTQNVDFDTRRPVYATRADKCHISHVVADTGTWEQKMAQVLEDMPEVFCYVKNDPHLGFTIPYTDDGKERQYIPDFIVRMDDGRGPDDPVNLIIEVTGEKKKDKEAKVSTARTLWVPAVNNHGALGRWAFVEIRDPWNAEGEIRAAIQAPATTP
jgi:type III restriction enzyme